MLMKCPRYHASSVGKSQKSITLPLPQSEPHRKLSHAGLSQQDLREAQLANPNLTEILKAKEVGKVTPPPMDTTRTGLGVERTHPPLEPTKGEEWSFMVRV